MGGKKEGRETETEKMREVKGEVYLEIFSPSVQCQSIIPFSTMSVYNTHEYLMTEP